MSWLNWEIQSEDAMVGGKEEGHDVEERFFFVFGVSSTVHFPLFEVP